MIKLLNKQHDCKKELKGVSLKITPARIAVLNFLETTKEPVDVGNILDFLREKDLNSDPATIFRMMNQFFEKGIIQRVQFGEGKYRYEKSDNDHHHLICTTCGKVEDIGDKNMKDFENEIKTKKGFLVKHHSLEFFGLCKNCQN